jgi:predicted AAA+ superfamily ATPase
LGGFPEILKIKDVTLVEQYFKDIIYRDVIARYAIRNIKELKELCLYLISNIATIYSYEKLKDLIKIKNISTIKNYLEILENVFLFFRVPIFDYSIKKQIYNPGKFYTVDIGLFQSTGFKFLKNIGHLYENIVFSELKRRNLELFYWKSKSGKEVDLVIRKGLKIHEAIQVCFSLNNPDTKKREFTALIEANQELKPLKFTIITDDEDKEEKVNNIKIKIIPLWKWLFRG